MLYGLYALLVIVNTGLCSFGSHTLTFLCIIGSSLGGLSTMYDIHACLELSAFYWCLLVSFDEHTSPAQSVT